jgi:antitoxin MazE
MKVRIVKIGNSQGIRIPKPLIRQAGIKEEVELRVEDNHLIISPADRPRSKWPEAFRLMAERGDDALIDGDSVGTSTWDEEGWEWK